MRGKKQGKHGIQKHGIQIHLLKISIQREITYTHPLKARIFRVRTKIGGDNFARFEEMLQSFCGGTYRCYIRICCCKEFPKELE